MYMQPDTERVRARSMWFFYTIRSIPHVRYDYTYGTGKMEKDGFGRFIIHTYIYYHVLTRSPPTPLLNRGVVLSVALLD